MQSDGDEEFFTYDNDEELLQCCNTIVTEIRNSNGYPRYDVHIGQVTGIISVDIYNQNRTRTSLGIKRCNNGVWIVDEDDHENRSFNNINDMFDFLRENINNRWKNVKGIYEEYGRRIIRTINDAGYTINQYLIKASPDVIRMCITTPLRVDMNIEISRNQNGQYRLANLDIANEPPRTFDNIDSLLQSLGTQLRSENWRIYGVQNIHHDSNYRVTHALDGVVDRYGHHLT